MFDKDDIRAQPLNTLVPGVPGPGGADREAGLDARIPSPPADLHHAFSENQIASKKWLVENLHETLGARFGTVYVLGGWYGVLGALLLNDLRFEINRILSFDINPACAEVADRINENHAGAAKLEAVTADVCDLAYRCFDDELAPAEGAARSRRAPNLVINTSCEHMEFTEAWYRRVPPGMLQVYQSNDNFDCPEHVNCATDLRAFKADLPMSDVYFEGALQRRKYTRFMLIGRK